TPGRTYVFYVRDDANCVRQSNVNVNDITTNPIDITASFEPSCNGADDGEITFSLTDNQAPAQPQMRWELFEVGNATAVETSGGNVAWSNTITVTGLEPGDYYIEVTEVDAGGTDVCESGSENVAIKELEALGGTPEVMEAISCASPGVIQIKTPSGGGGEYSYTLSSTNFVADITSDGRTIEVPISNLVDATSTPTTVTITVEDQYGCTGNLGNVSIAISQNPSIDSVAVQNCSVPFKVTVTASGGTTPYLYSLDGGASYTNSNVFNNVAVGSHDVVVLDGKGCSSTTTVTVHPALEASVEQTKLIDCVTSPNGQITLEVLKGSSGTGTANYEFEIDGPGTNDVAQTALTSNPFVWGGAATAGTYTVTIYDTGTSGPECSRSFDIVVPAAVEPSFGESHEDVSCNGASDGSITLNETDNGINPLTYSISPSPTGVTFNNTTKTFENLPAGTYIVTGRGTNGCETSLPGITIAEPNAITVPNPTVVDFACTAGNNPNNATITVDGTSITGGSGTYVRYEFIKDGSPDQVVQDGPNASYIETNVAGGDYTINVYDEKGCIGSTTATIDAFVEISDPVVSVTSDVTCNPGSDEAIQLSATVNPTTATPNLEFEVTGLGVTYNQTNTTGTFTGLGVGNYHVAITNTDTGCVIETTHQVEDPKTISVDATKLTDELCLNNGTDDGSFEVTISDYAGNYSYQVYDSEDNAITGQSGTGNTSTGLTVTGLPGGSYYVEITETAAPFCVEKSNLITINAPESAISATAEEEHSPSCSNDQGIILVDPEGGEGPYTIQLTNTTTTDSYTQNNVSAYVFEGLAAGSYNITITDALGCGFFEANKITLVRPDAISASIDASTLSCYNAANASITTNVDNRNVSPVYQYQLNTYTDASGSTLLTTSVKQDANSFGSLTSGFYSVTVTDDVGCSFQTAIEEIVNPEQVSAQLNLANALTCQSGVELLLSATGGSGSYEYSADGTTYTSMTGNSVSLPLTGTLGAGTYQYYVRDAANGCEAIQSNAITEDAIAPLSLTVDKTAATINCNGDNTAIIYADADGGLGDYQYELYSDASLSPAARIAGPLDQGVFPNLTAGTYYVTVVSGDCTTNAEEVIITEPTELTYSDEVVNVSCLGEEDGSITVTLSGGSGGYQYAISPNLDKFDEENTFTDLAAGEYTIIAQDGNGCFIKLEYEITEPTLLEVSGSATPEICTGSEDGTITIEITGGTAPYSSAINSNADADFVEGRTEFDNLPAGDHVILVRDANGCEANTVITVDAGVNLNATVEPVYECTGNLPDNRLAITLEDESVEGSIMYALDSTDSADMQLEPNFTNIAPGNHYLAIAHENGCIRTFHFDITAFEPLALSLEQRNLNEITAIATGGVSEYTFYFDGINNGNDNTFRIIETKTYEVRVVDQNGCEVVSEIFMEFIDLEIPNFFSPNGDGQNDVWIPENIEAFPEILIKIFDRYGRAIYDIRVDDAGWDGTYDLEGLPSGDYWYVIKLNGERDKREFVGHFNLYR
ncbi:MAG: T9SS type B sorting domain-containing protein, partial [Flavobacteriaceae bacterium]